MQAIKNRYVFVLLFVFLFFPCKGESKELQYRFYGGCATVYGGVVGVEHNGEYQMIRMLGVDYPPKSSPFYQKAVDFTRDTLRGMEVFVEHKEAVHGKVEFLPGFVFLKSGVFFNKLILKQGLGLLNEKDEFDIKDEFEDIRDYAKDSGIGYWKNKKYK